MIQKIAKLLALAADQGATPSERETAQAMASKLIDKHGIDLVDVVPEQEIKEFVYHVPGTKSTRVFLNLFAVACAKIFACKVYRIVGKGQMRIVFVGSDSNIESSIAMFEFIRTEADSCLAADKKISGGKGMKYNDSFLKGFGVGLQERVNTIMSTSTMKAALVPVNTAVTEFYATLGTRTGKTGVSSSAGYSAGKSAAGRATLNNGVK